MGRAFEYRKATKMKRWGNMARVFTKLGKQITIAVREGGPEADTNPRLRVLIQQAKKENMPKENVERAIKKASSREESDYKEMVYEGYGPNGVAVIVEAYTDNKNRTAGSVRHLFDKHGGNLGTTGSVTFMFNKKGEIIIEKTEELDEEELMMLTLDNGAEDFINEENVYEVITEPEAFLGVKDALVKENIELLEAAVTMIPNVYTDLDLETSEKFQKLIDALLEDDDVDNVYHNAEFHEDFEEN